MKGLKYYTKEYFNLEDDYVVQVYSGSYKISKLESKGSTRYYTKKGLPIFIDTIPCIKVSDLLGQEVELNGVRGKINNVVQLSNEVLGNVGVYWYNSPKKGCLNPYWTELNSNLKFI